MIQQPYPDKCTCGWSLPSEVFNYSIVGGTLFFRCPHCDTLWRVEEDKKNEYAKCGEA